MSLRAIWQRVTGSLWFVPGVMTTLAAVLAPLMVHVDVAYLPPARIEQYWWLFGGTPDGARGVLMAIATSLITVTGVVFSITIVALQLASSQFTPRVLQNFTGDRGNQLVLGVFIGTFTYTLLVLRTVRSASEDGAESFVPAASTTLAVVFALTSIAFLIYYINHVATWIEASTIINRVTRDTREVIERRLPDRGAREAPSTAGRRVPDGDAARLLATRSGYLQILRDRHLAANARDADLVVRVDAAVGDFVLEGTPLASVWPAGRLDEAIADELRDSFLFGHRRTLTEDLELGLVQLSDIAVKALSPGINDPTTATMAINRLGELVAELGRRPTRDAPEGDEEASAHVFLPVLRFERVVDVAFGQIRRYGGHDLEVMTRLARIVRQVAARVDSAQHPPLRDLLEAIADQAPEDLPLDIDRQRLRAEIEISLRVLA